MLTRTFANKIAGRHNGPEFGIPKSPNGLSFPGWGRFFGRSPRAGFVPVGTTFKSLALFSGPCPGSVACTALVRRPLSPAEAVPFVEETMDDLKNKGAADRNRINLQEPWK